MKQKYYLQINYLRLLTLTIAICFVSVVLFVVLAVYSENGDGTETGFHIVRAIFNVLNFPAIIFFKVMVFSGWLNLAAGILLSALFDGFLIEIIIIIYSRYVLKKRTGGNATT
jgi:hypothetical protein